VSESQEQCKVIQWARWNETKYPCLKWIFAVPNGAHMKSPRTAAKMKREGMKNGISDLMLPYPSKGYHGLFIEMKFGKNKLSKDQKEFLQYAESVGYLTAVCYNDLEAIAVLTEYLGG